MQPTDFEQSNRVLGPPPDWDAGKFDGKSCFAMHIHDDGRYLISRWALPWRERIAVLFGAPIWLFIVGRTHPPVGFVVGGKWGDNDATRNA